MPILDVFQLQQKDEARYWHPENSSHERDNVPSQHGSAAKNWNADNGKMWLYWTVYSSLAVYRSASSFVYTSGRCFNGFLILNFCSTCCTVVVLQTKVMPCAGVAPPTQPPSVRYTNRPPIPQLMHALCDGWRVEQCPRAWITLRSRPWRSCRPA